MPLLETIDPERKLVIVQGTGSLEPAETLAFVHTLVKRAPHHSGYDGLVDVRGVTVARLTPRDIEAIAAAMQEGDHFFRGTRWAVVTGSPVLYGLARMFASLRSDAPFEIRVFRSEDNVWDWLKPAEA